MKSPESALDYQHVDWASVPAEQLAEGIERRMIWGERLMMCRLVLRPHVVTAVHSHPHEQLTYVLSGAFEFTIGDETHVVRAGDTLHKRGGVLHGCRCIEKGVLLDTFTPQRMDFLPA